MALHFFRVFEFSYRFHASFGFWFVYCLKQVLEPTVIHSFLEFFILSVFISIFHPTDCLFLHCPWLWLWHPFLILFFSSVWSSFLTISFVLASFLRSLFVQQFAWEITIPFPKTLYWWPTWKRIKILNIRTVVVANNARCDAWFICTEWQEPFQAFYNFHFAGVVRKSFWLNTLFGIHSLAYCWKVFCFSAFVLCSSVNITISGFQGFKSVAHQKFLRDYGKTSRRTNQTSFFQWFLYLIDILEYISYNLGVFFGILNSFGCAKVMCHPFPFRYIQIGQISWILLFVNLFGDRTVGMGVINR